MPLSPYIVQMRAKIGTDLLMCVGASAVVIADDGKILLHQRTDNGLWSLPGGMVEPNEQPAEAAVRETREETGVIVEPVTLIGAYGGPEFFWTYPDGNQAVYTMVCFLCKPVGGAIAIDDDESSDVRYFDPTQLPTEIVPHHLIRIQHALGRRTSPYFDPAQP